VTPAPPPIDDLAEVRLRFGGSVDVVFDGTSEQCPVCDTTIEQLMLALDLGGIEPLACSGCGAVLAA